MDVFQIDWLAVLIAAVVNMLIGFVWFSPWLFGKIWKKLAKVESRGKKRELLAPLWSFLAVFLSAYVLGVFEMFLGVTTVSDGVFVGFLVWLGFVMTTQVSKIIWGSCSSQLFFIQTGYRLLAYLAMGGIIGA